MDSITHEGKMVKLNVNDTAGNVVTFVHTCATEYEARIIASAINRSTYHDSVLSLNDKSHLIDEKKLLQRRVKKLEAILYKLRWGGI